MKTQSNTILSIALFSMLVFGKSSFAQHRVAAGGWHSIAICSDSTVKTFGENATGQLGDGNSNDLSTPYTIPSLSQIVSVSAGGDQLEAHSMALKADGTVYAWGSNIYGALGNATTTNTNVPGQVLLLSGATAISAGGWHSVALKGDGTVWAWGWNTDGQLGDGTTVDKTIATQVPGLTGITAISAGTYHVLALKNDGTVWAWGDNISGQVGNGTTTDQTTPIQVTGLTDVAAISAGRFFSMAIKNDGTVWTWGENLYGQLGDGTTTNRTTPVQVSGLTDVTTTAYATGAFHCVVVKSDSTLWSWGRNTYGNLGDGSTTHRSLPVLVSGLTDAKGLAGGTNFTLSYKADGTMWNFGRNLSGQLGDGTLLQRNTPFQSVSDCPIIEEPNTNGISENELLSAVSAFPNPSSDGIFNLEIATEVKNDKIQIEVVNMLGEQMYSQSVSSSQNEITTIDLSNQPKGVYVLNISLNGSKITKKLINN